MGVSTILTHFAVILLFMVNYGSAQVFDVHPTNFTPNFTPAISLNCNIKSLLHAVNQVFVLQIDREEGGNLVPLATVTPSGVQLDSLNPGNRLSVQGSLDSSGPGPHLNLTIALPTEHDGGHYVCVASITDKTSTLVKLNYDLNITYQDLTNDQMKAAIFTLGQKVDQMEMANSNLLNTISRLERKSLDLQGDLTNATAANKDLSNKFSALERRLDVLERQLEQERKDNNATDSNVLKFMQDLTSQISNISSSQANNNNNNNINSMNFTAPNFSCCDSYDDLAKNVSAFQTIQSDSMRMLQEALSNYTRLASELVVFESSVDSAALRLAVLEKMTTGQYAEITDLQNSIKNRTDKPQAFSARNPSYTESYPNQTFTGDVGDLTFNSVSVDNLNAFDMSTGELTIMTTGNYMISLTLSLNMVLSAALEGGVKVNDYFVCFLSTSSHGILNSGSTTVIVHLDAGDKVKVKVDKVIAQPVTINSDTSTFSVMYLG